MKAPCPEIYDVPLRASSHERISLYEARILKAWQLAGEFEIQSAGATLPVGTAVQVSYAGFYVEVLGHRFPVPEIHCAEI